MLESIVSVGMDLGTSKTAVIASTGKRASFASVVGWPKDRFAESALGCDVLFGEAVYKHRLALHVVRPFAKGNLKFADPSEMGFTPTDVGEQKRAARLLIEQAVERVNVPQGASLHGVIGAPSRAGLSCRQTLIEAAESVFDTVVIVPEPFAVAYGMDCMQDTVVVDIGAGTIDICPMAGAYPAEEDQVTVPIGGDAIDEELQRQLRQDHPDVEVSLNMARVLKERYGFVREAREPIVVQLPAGSRLQEVDITESLRKACEIIIQPLLKGLEEVVRGVDPEFRSSMMGRILLSGGGSQLKGLERVIESAFEVIPNVRAEKVFDTRYAGAVGAYRLASAIPRDQWELVHKIARKPSAQLAGV